MTAVDFTSFVDQLATASGDTILPFFRTALAVENKKTAGFDPVTAADRAAENAMRALIRKHFPAHGILGEEYESENPDAEYVWVLDPIDGTKSFITGMPAWGTLIALTRAGVPVYGMMHQPFTRERFTGDGMMVFFNDPLPAPDAGRRAGGMAIAMQERAAVLKTKWRRLGYELGLGIGIAKGFATIGGIGFEGRLDYGAIGTVTNLAARLCGEAKPGQILISPRVLPDVEPLVEVEEMGLLAVKGLARPVRALNIVRLRT